MPLHARQSGASAAAHRDGAAALASTVRQMTLAALLLAAFAVPSAAAQKSGVHVDPDAPAGKEYAIPLDQARREAAGGGAESAGAKQPLFGAGIEPAGGASSRSGDRGVPGRTRDGGGGSADADALRRGRGSPGDERIAPVARKAAAIEAAASGNSSALITAGLAAAVLGAGLLAGLGLRKWLRGG